MGSSRPLFGLRQSSGRKEISRLPVIKSKTIAFIKRWSFLFRKGLKAFVTIRWRAVSCMNKHHRFQISMVVLFLCIGSLVALPVGNAITVLGLEISGIELENNNLFEHSESDEEVLIKIYWAAGDRLSSTQSQSTHLNVQDILLATVSPPPRHA